MATAGLLVVDDDSVIRLSIERAARKMGVARKVEFACNGREALDTLIALVTEDSARGYVVLLDINMPEMDGFEALERIKARSELAGVPVFMMSSSEAPTDIRRAYFSGVAGYVVKGATMASVHETLEFVESYFSRIRLLPPSSYADD